MSGKVILSFATACAVVTLFAGCAKKGPAAESTPAAEAPAATDATAAGPAKPAEAEPPIPALAGASGVHQALASKDYEGAVAQVAAMRGSVKREQWEQYVALQYEVRNALTEASEKDPKAAQALLTLNAVNRGR
jgi:hypothetical protein